MIPKIGVAKESRRLHVSLHGRHSNFLASGGSARNSVNRRVESGCLVNPCCALFVGTVVVVVVVAAFPSLLCFLFDFFEGHPNKF